MKKIDKKLKYLPLFTFLIYGLGFLIISIRLSMLNIFVKDFLTLDYIKAGLFFCIINIPLYLIKRQIKSEIKNRILRFIFYFFGCIAWFAMVNISLVDTNEINSDLFFYLSIYLLYPFIIYFFDIETVSIKMDSLIIGKKFVTGIILIHLFSTIIYFKIHFRLGGGAPYTKTITNISGDSSKIVYKDVKIYYENDGWIYFTDNDKVLTIPKKNIIKQESKMNEIKI